MKRSTNQLGDTFLPLLVDLFAMHPIHALKLDGLNWLTTAKQTQTGMASDLLCFQQTFPALGATFRPRVV